MLSLNLFRKPALRLAACLLLLAGILVWPVPQPARADNTDFVAHIQWDAAPNNPEEVVLQVVTYDESWVVVEQFTLTYISTDGNNLSIYKRSEPLPLDPDGVHWGVVILDAAGNSIVPAGGRTDGDATVFGGNNELDEPFEEE